MTQAIDPAWLALFPTEGPPDTASRAAEPVVGEDAGAGGPPRAAERHWLEFDRAPGAAADLLLLARAILRAIDASRDKPSRRWLLGEGAGTLRSALDRYQAEIGLLPPPDAGAARRRVAPVLEELVKTLDTVIGHDDPTLDSSYHFRLMQARVLRLLDAQDRALEKTRRLLAAIPAMQSHGLREDVVDLHFELCLRHGRLAEGARPLLRLQGERRIGRSLTGRFSRQLRLIARARQSLAPTGLAWSCRVIRLWAIASSLPPRRFSGRVASVLLDRPARFAFRREAGVRPPLGEAAKVFRVMGGIGDLLTMTPGLRALARRAGKPVEFAVPARFAALFEANRDVTIRAIEDLPEDWTRDAAIVDLTDCPAGAAESAVAPNVRVNRIELFARAMGIPDSELQRIGGRPAFEPTESAHARALDWLRLHGMEPGDFIAMQAAPAEPYRHYRRMPEVAEAVSAMLPVVVFNDRDVGGYDLANVTKAFDLDLDLCLAIACEARMMVAPESSFMHLAGARDLPCVLIAGPTDGKLRTRAYRNVVVVDMREMFRCIPCWRNAHIPCRVTGGADSVCLDLLPVERVVAAVLRMLAQIGDPERRAPS